MNETVKDERRGRHVSGHFVAGAQCCRELLISSYHNQSSEDCQKTVFLRFICVCVSSKHTVWPTCFLPLTCQFFHTDVSARSVTFCNSEHDLMVMVSGTCRPICAKFSGWKVQTMEARLSINWPRWKMLDNEAGRRLSMD